MCATFWCLLVNGFVGFQVVEDGTPTSLWVRRPLALLLSLMPPHSKPAHTPRLVMQILQGSSAIVGIIVGLIAIGTFKNAAGLSSATPTGLWVLQFVFNLACVVIYIVAQLLLVWRTLDDRWPIGDILFGTAFWVIGQVLLYGFSNQICDAVSHYLDGTFFHALCTLFAVMMGASARSRLPAPLIRLAPAQAQVVDCPVVTDAHFDVPQSTSTGIASRRRTCVPFPTLAFSSSSVLADSLSHPAAQLEFSVGSKTAAWDIKESLLDEDDRSYGQGAYPPQKSYSSYGY